MISFDSVVGGIAVSQCNWVNDARRLLRSLRLAPEASQCIVLDGVQDGIGNSECYGCWLLQHLTKR